MSKTSYSVDEKGAAMTAEAIDLPTAGRSIKLRADLDSSVAWISDGLFLTA